MKSSKRKNKKVSNPPGTLIHVGEVKQTESRLDTYHYTQENYSRTDSAPKSFELGDNYWMNLEGLGSVDQVAELAKHTNPHKLQIEDILNFDHRPKVEDVNGTILYIFKRIDINEQLALETEQISILVNQNILVSFQERSGDSFNHIREALKDQESNIRKHGVSYLFYRMIDSIADSYFEVTDQLEDHLTELESRIIADDPNVDLSEVLQIKKATYQVRKHIRPMREANIDLTKSNQLNQEGMDLFFKDVNDHLTHILEQCDGIVDSATNLISIYHSNSGNRLNEIMKRLTVVSTIFIPLSFLAGLYGMNFKYMPELNTKYGYPILIGIMLIIALIIYRFMKKSKWF